MALFEKLTRRLCEVGTPDPYEKVVTQRSQNRAWWDQTGIIGANDPEQPAALDLTDLRLTNGS